MQTDVQQSPQSGWDAVVAGHICLDIIPDLSNAFPSRAGASGAPSLASLLRPGKLVEVGDAVLSTGGAVSNTGLALHRLGIQTQLMGKVGADPLGRVVRDIVSRWAAHLADGMVEDPETGTSYTVIISPPGIDRVFLHSPGANNTFGADDVRYDVVARSRLFHFGYPPLMQRTYADHGRELTEIFRRVRQLNVTTSLDMALPDPNSEAGRVDWAAILTDTLPYVGIFLPSIEEILYMLRPDSYDDLSRSGSGNLMDSVTPELLTDVSEELLALGVGIVGLKLGERGFYLRTANATKLASLGKAAPADLSDWADRELWAPCFRANLVGTTGAGDATIAGFLSALLRGLPVMQAVTMAVAVGACNVEAADALSGLLGWEETVARVAEGWEHHPMTLSDTAWVYLWDAGLWAREAGR